MEPLILTNRRNELPGKCPLHKLVMWKSMVELVVTFSEDPLFPDTYIAKDDPKFEDLEVGWGYTNLEAFDDALEAVTRNGGRLSETVQYMRKTISNEVRADRNGNKKISATLRFNYAENQRIFRVLDFHGEPLCYVKIAYGRTHKHFEHLPLKGGAYKFIEPVECEEDPRNPIEEALGESVIKLQPVVYSDLKPLWSVVFTYPAMEQQIIKSTHVSEKEARKLARKMWSEEFDGTCSDKKLTELLESPWDLRGGNIRIHHHTPELSNEAIWYTAKNRILR